MGRGDSSDTWNLAVITWAESNATALLRLLALSLCEICIKQRMKIEKTMSFFRMQ